MAKKDYSNYSKEELIKIVHKLEKKRYGLVWEDKPEALAQECKTKLPVLKEVKTKEIKTDKNKPKHIFIEGDNYHALKVLNYTHEKSIDVIYIDPPYNTGAKDWKYNNNFVDENDGFRHSKWISMMNNRLKLAKKLLTKRGILICAIDEYEVHNIRHLLDSILGMRNKLGMVTVLHNPKGRNLSKFFSANSEFMLIYAKDIDHAVFNNVAIDEEVLASFDSKDNEGKFRLESFMRVRTTWSRKNKPQNYYPLYVSKDLKIISLEKKEGFIEVYPKTKDGREWAWKNISESFKKLNKEDYFQAKLEADGIVIYHKYREKQVLKNVWTNKKYQSEFNGTNLLKKILGGNYFNYPKSLYLLTDILKITATRDSTILDFFAGSGTTGHAVLELNKDGGNRKFILCTNNENQIAEQVCYPRIKKVIEGYKNSNDEFISGLGGNLKYYKTDFVPFANTDSDKRALTNRSTEMLCMAEETYDEILFKPGEFSLFENKNKITAIIYDEDSIDSCKAEIKKHQKSITIYVFSYDKEYNPEDFDDLKGRIKIKPIPEAILNIYRRIGRR